MFVYWIVGTRLVAAALASVCWTLIVQQAPPSFPYPFTALGFVFVPLGAMLVFGEPIATEQWVGMLMIGPGVLAPALSVGADTLSDLAVPAGSAHRPIVFTATADALPSARRRTRPGRPNARPGPPGICSVRVASAPARSDPRSAA